MSYELLLTLHIASVVLLLGVGGGSAFYKFMSDRSGKVDSSWCFLFYGYGLDICLDDLEIARKFIRNIYTDIMPV
jgi:hypothetical protein